MLKDEKRAMNLVKKVPEMMMISGWEWMNAKRFINVFLKMSMLPIDGMHAAQNDEP